jgi:hypothetical protein
MNFQELLAKMVEIDTKTNTTDAPVTEMPIVAPSMPVKDDTPPPSMSVNINAQGMDNIEDMLKLMTKVNPDMINQPPAPVMPTMAPMMGPKPINKLIPDFDGDNNDMPGGEKDDADDKMDIIKIDDAAKDDKDFDYDGDGKLDRHEKAHAGEVDLHKTVDRDGDGDHDMDDHAAEKDSEDKKEKDEAYENEPDEEVRGVDYMVNKLAGGMNRPKGTHPKVAGADNPMQRVREGEDLRAHIKAELAQRLAEVKGAK